MLTPEPFLLAKAAEAVAQTARAFLRRLLGIAAAAAILALVTQAFVT